MNHHRSRKLAAVAALLAPLLAFALPEDRNKPIELVADSARWDQNTGVSVYEGNVTITQGTMRLQADTVTIRMKDGEFDTMEAVGRPAVLRVIPARNKQEIVGTGQRVDYDVKSSLLVLTVNARVTQGKDVFSGDRIEYNLDRDQVRARTAPGGGGRVTVTIQPKAADRPKP
ncbi:MAG: lipopolysaccharide transport periplasmic protein LptA [Pseudomonadota bacterium]|nr:lipopolysaccharide transport periplasmic protein LptA [Pseudomonadota bacterium]